MMQELPLGRRGSARPMLGLLLAGLLLQAGCSQYHPLALNDHPQWPASADHLVVDRAKIPFPRLAAHPFDPLDGLDMTEVAMLAVANNPGLKLARDSAGIGHAQAFAAGLLPDPQYMTTRDMTAAHVPGLMQGHEYGIGYPLRSLLVHDVRQGAAQAASRQIDLNLLWQEWQVVSKARLLFSRIISEQRLLGWLRRNQGLLHDEYLRLKAASEAGDITAAAANVSLVAWLGISQQANVLQRQLLQTRRALNALLGLPPDSALRLVDGAPLAMPDKAGVAQALAELPQHRPDLLALRAGYRAQDARYRQAILEQFPPIFLAFNIANDTGGIFTHGVDITMAIPLLNANRGQIAVSKATRRRLHDEYENRVLAARAMVKRLLADSRLLSAQLASVHAGLPQLDAVAKSARQRLEHGDMDEAGFVPIDSARINKHIEAIKLQQSLLEDRIGLLALLGFDGAGVHP